MLFYFFILILAMSSCGNAVQKPQPNSVIHEIEVEAKDLNLEHDGLIYCITSGQYPIFTGSEIFIRNLNHLTDSLVREYGHSFIANCKEMESDGFGEGAAMQEWSYKVNITKKILSCWIQLNEEPLGAAFSQAKFWTFNYDLATEEPVTLDKYLKKDQVDSLVAYAIESLEESDRLPKTNKEELIQYLNNIKELPFFVGKEMLLIDISPVEISLNPYLEIPGSVLKS